MCAAATVATVAAATPVVAQVGACQNEALAPPQRIAACTNVIEDQKQKADVRAEALANRGSAFDDQDKYDEAIADYDAALKLSPGDPAVLILRGNAYDAKGDKQKAIADYTAAIKINPDDAAGYYNRATVYQELGQRERAIADYKKALEIMPKHAGAQEGLAEVIKSSPARK